MTVYRNGLAAQWKTVTPILESREPGWETDTLRFKVGDGSTHWVDLPYVSGIGGA